MESMFPSTAQSRAILHLTSPHTSAFLPATPIPIFNNSRWFNHRLLAPRTHCGRYDRTLPRPFSTCTISLDYPHHPVTRPHLDPFACLNSPPSHTMSPPSVSVVFSDLDGTLVHSPKHFASFAEIVSSNEEENTAVIRYKHSGETRECIALPSKTAGNGYISRRTIELVDELRKLGTVFVIITGARASTYAKRRPYLPQADFECYENGGRMLIDGVLEPTWSESFASFTGPLSDRTAISPVLRPPSERQGSLWKLYQRLEDGGWKLDANDYSTNFRVDVNKSDGKTAEDFEREVIPLIKKEGLTTTFNLGKADVYPSASGKANAARHILQKISASADDAIALFDDDNDLELGALCGTAFLPSVTHPSVLRAVKQNPNWTVMQRAGFLGTEDALERVIGLRKAALEAKQAPALVAS